MERGVGDRGAAHADRRKPRDGRQRPGAADLHFDVENLGDRLLRRVFVCEGEAGRARDETERALVAEIVDLVDHPVDRVGQALALLAHFLVESEQPAQAPYRRALRGNGQAFPRKPVQDLAVTLERQLHRVAYAIGEEPQRTLNRDPGVELPQRAGSGIARIDELLLTTLALAGIDALEIGLVHDDLAAHLDRPGGASPSQPERDRPHRPQVCRHVLSGVSVAPGRSPDETPALVKQTDRQPVELRLRRVLDLVLAQSLPSATIESDHVLVAERIVEGKHRHGMDHLGKFL